VNVNPDHETKFLCAISSEECSSWMNSIGKVTGLSSNVQMTSSISNLKENEKDDDMLDEWTVISTEIENKPLDSVEIQRRSKIEDDLKKIPENIFSKERLEYLFDQYADASSVENNDECISAEGIDRLCKDVDVNPENIVVLIFSWNLNAKKMGYFTKQEFISGMEKMGIDTITKLKTKLKSMEKQNLPEKQFKEFYKYCFIFAKEEEQRSLDIELASALLTIVLKEKYECKHIEDFCQFILQACKAINLDQWMNFYLFSTTIKIDLSNYSPQDAWPILFDEFVDWKKAQK